MINDGLTPVVAWRLLFGLTQSDHARRAGVCQHWVNWSAEEGAWQAGRATEAGGRAGSAGLGVGDWR
jgi:hypothetical protein